MADSKWLFPESANIVARAHDQYFGDMLENGRRLTRKELQRYEVFPVGWRTAVQISGKAIELDVLLEKDIPFSEPRIALANSEHHLIWPHVEGNGLLCLRTSADMIDHKAGVNLTSHYIEEARTLLRDSISGRIWEDFATEFGSYWGRWSEIRKGRKGSVWLLAKPEPPSRVVYCADFGNVQVVADSVEEGIHWARCYFHKEEINAKQFKPAAFLWMEQALMPDEYPRHNGDVADMFRNCRCHDLLLLLSPVKNGPT